MCSTGEVPWRAPGWLRDREAFAGLGRTQVALGTTAGQTKWRLFGCKGRRHEDLARLVTTSWFRATATVRTGFQRDETWSGASQALSVSWSQCWWRGVVVFLLERCRNTHGSTYAEQSVCLTEVSEFHTLLRKRYQVLVGCHKWWVCHWRSLGSLGDYNDICVNTNSLSKANRYLVNSTS